MNNMTKLIDHLCSIDDDCGTVSVETLDDFSLQLLIAVLQDLQHDPDVFNYDDIEFDVRFERLETIHKH